MGIKRYKTSQGWRWKNSFKLGGVKHRRQGLKSRAEAVEWELKERERLQRIGPSYSFGAMVDEYLDHCRARMRHNTVRQKHHVYQLFLERIGGDRPVEEVTPRMISGHVQSIAILNPKTANRHLRDLKAAYNWALRQERIDGRNPCRSIEPYAEDPHLPYVPPTEDYRAVLLVASRDEQDFLETLYHTVSRRREILRLTWNDVDFQAGWIRTYTRKRKGGGLEPMDKPMSSALRRALEARRKRQDKRVQKVFSFEQKALDRMMPRLCAKAQVKPFGFHALRHLAASNLVQAGVGMQAAQKLLGHKRLTTTEIYVHTLDDALREAVEVLGGQPSEELTHSKPIGKGERK